MKPRRGLMRQGCFGRCRSGGGWAAGGTGRGGGRGAGGRVAGGRGRRGAAGRRLAGNRWRSVPVGCCGGRWAAGDRVRRRGHDRDDGPGWCWRRCRLGGRERACWSRACARCRGGVIGFVRIVLRLSGRGTCRRRCGWRRRLGSPRVGLRDLQRRARCIDGRASSRFAGRFALGICARTGCGLGRAASGGGFRLTGSFGRPGQRGAEGRRMAAARRRLCIGLSICDRR